MKCELGKAYLDNGPECSQEATKAWQLDDDRIVKLCDDCSLKYWAALNGPEEVPFDSPTQSN
jgi:hypothetical protein